MKFLLKIHVDSTPLISDNGVFMKSYRLATTQSRCIVNIDMWWRSRIKKRKRVRRKIKIKYHRLRFFMHKYRYRQTLRAVAWSEEPVNYLTTLHQKVSGPKRLSIYAQTLLLNQANSATFGHPFHIVNPSFLPANASLGIFSGFHFLLMGLRFSPEFNECVVFFHGYGVAVFFAVMVNWMLEVAREEQRGAHTFEVQQGFRFGILLFIASEFMLFVAFFWAVFHTALNPSVMVGNTFLPVGIAPTFVGRIPLAATWLLLTSGLSITIAHQHVAQKDTAFRLQSWLMYLGQALHFPTFRPFHRISYELFAMFFEGRYRYWRRWSLRYHRKPGGWRSAGDGHLRKGTGFAVRYGLTKRQRQQHTRSINYPSLWVVDTAARGVVFLSLQAYEYTVCDFNITDSIYGSLFYSLTGLHGFHVLIGVVSLAMFLGFSTKPVVAMWFHWRQRIAAPHLNFWMSYRFNWWSHRVAFDGAVWYWHFVDVVWLVVLYVIYFCPFQDPRPLQIMARGLFGPMRMPGFEF